MSIPKGNLNKPTDAFVNLMNQLNNFTGNEKENELNLPNCKYRDTDYFKNLTKILPKIFRGRPCLFSIWMFAHLLTILMILTYYSVI